MGHAEQLEAAAKIGLDMKLGVGKELRKVAGHLMQDENVLYLTDGFYKGRGIILVTDKRVIFFSAGLLNSRVEEFPIKSISSIQYKTGLMFGTLEIYASNNKAEIEQVLKERVAAMTKIIRDLMETSSQPQAAAVAPSPATAAEQIRELAQLRDDGLITSEEFDEKKRSILGL
jgi:hypothetical protein